MRKHQCAALYPERAFDSSPTPPNASFLPEHLHRRRLRIAVEDGIYVFHDVGADVEEASLVLDRNQGALGAVVFAICSGSVRERSGLMFPWTLILPRTRRAGLTGTFRRAE
jgi:hypothetical protein